MATELKNGYMYITNTNKSMGFVCLRYDKRFGAIVCPIQKENGVLGFEFKGNDGKSIYLDIPSIDHKSLKWIENYNPLEMGVISDESLRAIVRRISYYLLGVIYIGDNNQSYYDKNAYEKMFNWDESISNEETNYETEVINSIINGNLISTLGVSNSFADMPIFKGLISKDNFDYVKKQSKSIGMTELIEPNHSYLPFEELLEISNTEAPKENVKYSEEWELDHKFYNLLDAYNAGKEEVSRNRSEEEKNTIDVIVASKSDKIITEVIKTDERWIFSKREIIAISKLNKKAVMNLYNVTSSVAAKYIYASKYILGINRNKTFNYIYCDLFNKGMSKDEVAELYPDKKSLIDISYKRWRLNRFTDSDCTYAVNRWRTFNGMDTESLAHYIYNTTFIEFGEKEHCRYHCASEIINNIKINELAKNPFAVVGFNDMAFNEKDFNLFKESLNQNHVPFRCDAAIIDIVDELKESYINTFDNHASIISGFIDIPKSVPENLNTQFLWLLKARFGMTTLSKLSNEDKSFIMNNRPENIAAKYLWRYDKIKNTISQIKSADI